MTYLTRTYQYHIEYNSPVRSGEIRNKLFIVAFDGQHGIIVSCHKMDEGSNITGRIYSIFVLLC